MATLQIVFNCLCLYVRDEPGKTVHVVMPATRGHDPRHLHLARLQHPSFPEPEGKRPLEGWGLTLGSASQPASAQTDTLAPRQNDEILDLTAATADAATPGGRKVKQEMVTGFHRAVAARVTLRSGKVMGRGSETLWDFNGRRVRMATRVIWEMEIDDVHAPLSWQPIGASGQPPLDSLAALGGGDEPLLDEHEQETGRRGYRLQVIHATPRSVAPRRGDRPLPDVLRADRAHPHDRSAASQRAGRPNGQLRGRPGGDGVNTNDAGGAGAACAAAGRTCRPIGGARIAGREGRHA